MKKRIVGMVALTMGILGIGGHKVQAQSQLTLDDVVPGGKGYWQLQPEMPRVLGVLPEGILLFGTQALEVQSMDGSRKTYIAKPKDDRLPPLAPTGDGRFLTAKMGNSFFVMNAGSNRIDKMELREELGELTLSPSGDVLASSDGKNIFISRRGESGIEQLTTDGSHDMVYGMPAHRNEFGIESGLFFSPSGRYLAFYRIDQSKVADYPIVRMGGRIAKADPLKYPMAGEASQEVTIGICDLQTKDIKYTWLCRSPRQSAC